MYNLFSVLFFPFVFKFSVETLPYYQSFWMTGGPFGMTMTFIAFLPCYCVLYDFLKNRSSNNMITLWVMSTMFLWGFDMAYPDYSGFIVFAATYPIAVFILVAEWIMKEAKSMMRFTSS